MGSKSGVPTQLSTVQIVQQQPGGAGQKTLPNTVTMQQLQQVMKHVQPQHITQVC